ncbi:MAG: hypothetical protein KDC46_03965 [Thermoleophilia bacterium]|nr:hypothetical protein [Thermoleophilia bacterium]
MDIASTTPIPLGTTDPIAWLLLETRGPLRIADEPYALSNIRFDAKVPSQVTLVDGTLSWPGGRGNPWSMWQSLPSVVRSGVDPDAARADVLAGVANLTAALEQALPELSTFAVPVTDRLPRDPDTYEILLRRESGNRERYIVPWSQWPASLRDAQAAQRQLESTLRGDYEDLDPPDSWYLAGRPVPADDVSHHTDGNRH